MKYISYWLALIYISALPGCGRTLEFRATEEAYEMTRGAITYYENLIPPDQRVITWGVDIDSALVMIKERDGNVLASARPGRKEIWIDPKVLGRSPRQQTWVVLHEMGHMAGLGHVTSSNNVGDCEIMQPSLAFCLTDNFNDAILRFNEELLKVTR